MVSYEQIENGAVAWLDAELLPGLPVNGKYDALKKIAVTTAALYCLRRIQRLLDGYSVPLRAIGAMDDNGLLDLDGVADIFRERVPAEGIMINTPLTGEITFHRSDVDNVKRYIMKGENA